MNNKIKEILKITLIVAVTFIMCIAVYMVLNNKNINLPKKEEIKEINLKEDNKTISIKDKEQIEEIYKILGEKEDLAYKEWPTYDKEKIIDDEIEVPVQLNGKLKAVVKVAKDASEEEVKNVVHENETIQGLVEGKNIVKEIYVKGKIYNIVVK